METLRLLFPPKPQLTDDAISSQKGKVFIITGASSGIGLELTKLLYAKHATVYVAARSAPNAEAAITSIKAAHPSSTGTLTFLHLDLSDLASIKSSATTFLTQESRLDVLFNNAGVMVPPQGSKSAQGHELQLGTNNLGHFLFTQLLTPLLVETARTAPKYSVRVIWVSSSAALMAPTGGPDLDNLDYHRSENVWQKYSVSKTGNYYHAVEYARLHAADGIVSVSLNPGNLKSNLQRSVPWWQMMLFSWILYDPVYGAYTELFAGFSPEVTAEVGTAGKFLQPWGRITDMRADLLKSAKGETQGGTGKAERFWKWSEENTKAFA